MRSEKRKHDTAPSEQFAEFMKTGWSPSDREGLQPLEVVTYAYSRRQVLSSAFPGTRILIKAGSYKVRANDTDYNYRPDSAFVYYSGVQGSDATADAVLVLEPNGDSNAAKNKISLFNDEEYTNKEITVSSKLFNENQSIVVLKSFTHTDAEEYVDRFKSDKTILAEYANLPIYLISQENLKILFEKHNLEDYKTFYTEYFK